MRSQRCLAGPSTSAVVPVQLREALDRELLVCLNSSVALLGFSSRLSRLFGSGDIAQNAAERIGRVYGSTTFGMPRIC